MRSVWKYPINSPDDLVIEMPRGAKVLTVAMQDGVPTIWAMVDLDAPRETRTFAMTGTGHTVPDEWADYPYLGSCVGVEGWLVFHFFEVVAT